MSQKLLNNKTAANLLIGYYGILQTFHLIMNIFPIFINKQKYISLISPNFTNSTINALFFSAIVDFFIASPLGVVFAYSYFKEKPKWTIGLVSVIVALISAVYYQTSESLSSLWLE